MAWNPSPKVADCRDIAQKWGGKSHVIIIAIDSTAETIQMATYGRSVIQCADAKRMGDLAYDVVRNAYGDPNVQSEDTMDAAPVEPPEPGALFCKHLEKALFYARATTTITAHALMMARSTFALIRREMDAMVVNQKPTKENG